MSKRYSESVVSATKNLPVPETKYDTPKEVFANQFSAMNTGVSQEGGLATLSFKSLEYTQLIEKLELMRDALLDEHASNTIRISGEVFPADEIVSNLKKDIQQLKQSKPQVSTDAQEITALNEQLDQLVSSQGDISALGDKLKQEVKRPEDKLLVNPPPYTKPEFQVQIGAQQKSDVENLDETPYQKKGDDSYHESEDVEMD